MGVFRLFTKLFSIIERFRFGLDYPTGAVFCDFEPLKVIHLTDISILVQKLVLIGTVV